MTRALLAVVLVAVSACSGSSYTVSFEKTGVDFSAVQFPVSMSASLVDDKGLVGPADYRKVGDYAFQQNVCDAPLDLSTSINDQIRRAGGDAMVLLEVDIASKENCHDFKARGDIVKIARREPGARPAGS